MKPWLPLLKSFHCVLSLLLGCATSFAQHHSMSTMNGMQANGGNCCQSPIMSIKPLAPAVIMEGIGKSHFPITTKSVKAQQFFDQGLALIQDFWYLEAFRSFKEAAKNDSNSAMAYWGLAHAIGAGFYSGDSILLSEKKRALQRAQQLSSTITPEEKKIIAIEVKKDSLKNTNLRAKADSLIAGDIQQYINQYPDNPDMVNIMVHNLFSGYDELRHPKGTQLLAEYIIQDMLQKYPNHHGLNHYYIHAVELGPYPERAMPCAEKVGLLAPKSGHMVHMAGHTYFNTGYYTKAHDALLAAYKVDSAYLADSKVSKIDYWHYDHNLHFMIMNCAEDGRLREGLKWVELLYKVDTSNFSLAYPTKKGMNNYIKSASMEEKGVKATLYERYGDLKKASEIYNAGVPDSVRSEDTYSMYLRGMTALAENDIKTAENTANELDAYLFKNQFTVKESYILRMHLLSAKGKYKDAEPYFQKALEKEAKRDMFNDPGVPLIASHEMGIIYRENKEYEKAVAAFNDELKVYRLNGHTYYQLAKTYAAWGKNKEAKEYYQKLLEAWKYGDSDLPQITEAKEWLKNNDSAFK